MSVSSAQAQAAAHPCSHDADDVGEEGRVGYPLDLETTLQKKLHVVNSGDRDRTEQLSESETPYSVSSRTRSKMKDSGRVRHGATEYCDEDTGCRDGDGNTERPTAKGDRATESLGSLSLGLHYRW